MSKINFLTPDKPDFEQIRHQIRGILDSYSHEWDLLAELAQNAIDAIVDVGAGRGRVDLVFDAANRRISFTDNGSGIDQADIVRLLRPFGTNKIGRANQIGQKGVGLKFVIFTSSSFVITTASSEGSCTATIEGAKAWSEAKDDNPLELDIDHEAGLESKGTKVELTLADPNHPIFNYSFEDLLFLLRTKTALGNANYIWAEPLKAKFSLTYIDKGGDKKSGTFDCKYLLPTELLAAGDIEDLRGFQQWLKDGDHSDQEKRRKLLDKVITAKGTRVVLGRTVRYWSCFVPGRETWAKLSRKAGLVEPSADSSGAVLDRPGVGFQGGFETATKGMPTGISIELKPRGQAGYLPNFFMLIDDPSLSFDIGRKSVHGKQQALLREIAFEYFREYLKDTRKYLGGDLDTFESMGNRDEMFDEIAHLPDLNCPISRFIKRPNNQEATVAALFFEQIGRGEFNDVRPFVSGYKQRYDVYALWKKRKIVVEFKFNLLGLFKDFSDERKIFNDINVVVLWAITEEDRVEAKLHGVGIEALDIRTLADSGAFPHATHLLTLGGAAPVFVVEMQRLLDAK